MKRNSTRILSLLLALVLAFSAFSVTALAHEKTYAITVYDDAGDGYLTLNKSEAKEDDTVYIYAHPESGNWLTYLKVTNSRGYELSVSYVRKNVYSFTMPASAVTIKAVFAPKWLTIAGILGIFEDNSSDFPFTDVALGTWYYQAVEFVYDYGYMDGVSATRFDPDGALSRGMLAKVLYNVEEEQRDFPTEFSDVPNSAWYADAVNWAAANDIVKGYGKDKFGPEDLVTREQMAAILYRYAQYKGYDVSAKADLIKFIDADEISNYALEALQWANAEGLINGKGDGVLDPKGQATRAEAAAMFTRFCEQYAEK